MALFNFDVVVIVNWLIATLTLVIMELVLFACFVGTGLLVRQAFGLRSLAVDDVFVAFWMGFAISTLFLVVWNFAFPIHGGVLLLFGIVGISGLWGSRVRLADMCRSARGNVHVVYVVALVLVGIWMANISMVELKQWDSETYHIHAVKWAKAFPVVPGLANLHGPLAFNNSSFLYDAMLDSGILSGRAYHVANGLLVLALFGQGLLAIARLFGRLTAPSPTGIFDVIMLAPAVILVDPDKITSYATDPPVTAVVLVALSLLYRYLSGKQGWTEKERAYAVVCIGVLLSLAISVKLNHAIFSSVAWLVTALVWVRRPEKYRFKTAVWAMGYSTALVAGVMVRGVILSGWPVFPSTLLGGSVDWQAPVEHARAEYAMIVHSGRNTVGSVQSGVDSIRRWFPIWLRHVCKSPYEFLVPLIIIIVISVCYLALVRWSEYEPQQETTAPWMILVPTGIALMAWFATAPEARYATHLLWGMVAVLVAQGVRRFGPWFGVGLNRSILCCLIAVALGAVVINARFARLWVSNKEYGTIVRALLSFHVKPPPRDGVLPKLQTPTALGVFTTRSGFKVNVPLKNGGRCMDAPIPCTPNPAPNLRLRDASKLGAGFKVEGPWEMQKWPKEHWPHFLPALRKIWQRNDTLTSRVVGNELLND